MRRTEIPIEGLRALAWAGDDLIDWIGGRRVRVDGTVLEFGVGDAYRFDGTAALRDVGATFETLGTKGRLMRWNGRIREGNYVPLGFEEIRELDRSYYCAKAYAYPLCVFELPDGRPAIAHCPRVYDTLQIELLDGTALTHRDAKSEDIFHARLAASADGRWLLDNAWVWHPRSIVCVYDVARALVEPEHLSTSGLSLDFGEAFEGEVEAATLSADRVVASGDADCPMLSVAELPSGKNLAAIRLSERLGTRLMAWGPEHVVALDDHPRVVALADGAIVHRWDDLDAGSRSQPSVSLEAPTGPYVAVDPLRPRFAVADARRIVVIEYD